MTDFFKGNALPTSVWKDKYALRDKQEIIIETNPDQTLRRLAKEVYRVYSLNIDSSTTSSDFTDKLSEYGRLRAMLTEYSVYRLIQDFKYIIYSGSVMSMCGNPYSIGSVSNCFVIGQPEDSSNGIMIKRTDQFNLMKRRGGVGKDLSKLRPKGASVNNAAKTSTGAASFMNVDSAITNEVAQGGRRGALMLSIDIRHPDSLEFITKKQDLTQVTGANISVKIPDDFMRAVEKDEDYILRYPIDIEVKYSSYPYNQLIDLGFGHYCKRVRAKELWDTLIKCAHNTAEPGIMFEDMHHEYSPDSVYPQYRGVTTNPCFHPDTLVDTINGKVKISDIKNPTYVYSMDNNGKLCIKKSSASFISKKNAQTLKITLRCGSSIQITEEHKLYVQDKGWVEAKDLKINDRIVHILRARRGKKYVGVKLTTEDNRDYRMEHRFIYESINSITSNDIHHKDGDTYNNIIDNLESVPHNEHSRITALYQNPQTHQIVCDKTGRFLSNPNKVITGIKQIPDEIGTKFKSKWDNAIINIEQGETTDVYDIQVEDTHCLIANNMVAHNCGN